jgi:hypothetical protein
MEEPSLGPGAAWVSGLLILMRCCGGLTEEAGVGFAVQVAALAAGGEVAREPCGSDRKEELSSTSDREGKVSCTGKL